MCCGLAVRTAGPILRGAATHTPGGAEVASVISGRSGDTVRWVCVVHAGWFGLGCRRSGRYTIRLGRFAWWPVGRNTLVGLLHCWDAPAIPWSWERK